MTYLILMGATSSDEVLKTLLDGGIKSGPKFKKDLANYDLSALQIEDGVFTAFSARGCMYIENHMQIYLEKAPIIISGHSFLSNPEQIEEWKIKIPPVITHVLQRFDGRFMPICNASSTPLELLSKRPYVFEHKEYDLFLGKTISGEHVVCLGQWNDGI